MEKLPVKSLIQSRSVSKSWKSLIDSCDFIADHTRKNTQQMQHLLIVSHEYDPTVDSDVKCLFYADDDTFPQQKVPLTLPMLGNLLKYPHIIGSSHGLLCWYNSKGGRAIIWNPCIRKAIVVAIDIPDWETSIYDAVLGFGVCRETRDPKLLKITYVNMWGDSESMDSIPSQVEVFTLSGGAWRTSYGNFPRKSIHFCTFQVVIGGILYFLAVDRANTAGECNLIISFDMTSEEFGEVNLPHSLAYGDPARLSISKLRESLVVIQIDMELESVVWMMEDGVPELFTKLFTINTNTPYGEIRGFRKSGEPLFQTLNGFCKVVAYEANLRHIDNLRIEVIGYSIAVYPYVETLLLLDHPNLKMFCLGN